MLFQPFLKDAARHHLLAGRSLFKNLGEIPGQR
jgi:hypothetical protein